MGPEAEARRLRGLSAAALSDALEKRGVLGSQLRRLHGSGTVAGRAVTARCAEGSAAAMLRAMAEAGPGDALVVQGEGEWGYFGELLGAEAARRGVVAVVVDGLVRDLDRLSTLTPALFARGTTPRGGVPTGGGEVGVPLEIGEATVVPGDWVVGDADGVVAVPAERAAEAIARAEEIEAKEAAAWERVRTGGSIFEEAGQYGARIGDAMTEGR